MELLTAAASGPLAGLAAGLALGAVHACEADHVITVTSIVRHGRRPCAALGYGLRWACGHGAALITAGVLLAALGRSFPEALGAAAEALVAVVLCALGGGLLHGARAPRPRAAVAPAAGGARGCGTCVLGGLHGLAGAAPVLALIPRGARTDAWFTGFYLLCFSCGVVLAMIGVAGVLGSAWARADGRGPGLEQVLSVATGSAALLVGLYMLASVVGHAGPA